MSEQTEIRREKLAILKKEGKDPFEITSYKRESYSLDIINNFDELDGKETSIAGRLMSKRLMGKAAFSDVQDSKGRLQIFVSKKELGEEAFEDYKDLDIGDIVGVIGSVMRTKTGETSLRASEIVLLAKCLQVLPEKFHGLRDQEARYRRRYEDLIVNPETRAVFEKRAAIINAIRAFLNERGFLEVETPVLNTIADGASARPFITKHNALDLEMRLRIALELPLKRLLVGGFDKVYELGRVFRNEGMSVRHNPEFTMLELYEAYTDYKGMTELCEELIRRCAKAALFENSQELDFSKPFERITMEEAVKKYVNVDFANLNQNEALNLAKEKGFEIQNWHTKGHILELLFERYVEKELISPTFVFDYPIEISPLTKQKPDRSDLTERFELFIMGQEIANAYSELNDPDEQRSRFMAQEKARRAGNEEAAPPDEDFLLALEYALPPTGGMGIGIDRLVTLLTGVSSIRDVLLFPTMKPI